MTADNNEQFYDEIPLWVHTKIRLHLFLNLDGWFFGTNHFLLGILRFWPFRLFPTFDSSIKRTVHSITCLCRQPFHPTVPTQWQDLTTARLFWHWHFRRCSSCWELVRTIQFLSEIDCDFYSCFSSYLSFSSSISRPGNFYSPLWLINSYNLK